MTMERQNVETPWVDAEVYTADGDKLGKVKEILEGFFKVNASMRPDYWLSTDHVQSADANRVVLDFHKDRLEEHEFDVPPTLPENGIYEQGGPGSSPVETSDARYVEPRTWDGTTPPHQEQFERRYVDTSQDWVREEPARRFVDEMRQDPRFQGRRFDEVAPELHAGFGDWAREHGYPADESGWERSLDSLRTAWNSDLDNRQRQAA